MNFSYWKSRRNVALERARGRWRDIFVSCGIPAQLVDGSSRPCPVCGGRGELKTARTVCYEIMREIVRLSRQYQETKEFRIVASEVVIDMLLEEESAALELLQNCVQKPVLLEVESSYHQEDYDVVLA